VRFCFEPDCHTDCHRPYTDLPETLSLALPKLDDIVVIPGGLGRLDLAEGSGGLGRGGDDIF
jgi:hypothetical protein